MRPATRQGSGPGPSSGCAAEARPAGIISASASASRAAPNAERAPGRERALNPRSMASFPVGAGLEQEVEREAMSAAQVLHVGEGVVEIRLAGHGDREVESESAGNAFGIVVEVVAPAQERELFEGVLRADVEPL